MAKTELSNLMAASGICWQLAGLVVEATVYAANVQDRTGVRLLLTDINS